MRQILFNLLSNAAKFTEKGVIRLSVARVGETVATDDPAAQGTAVSNEHLVFKVIDNGIGMTSEQIARLFRAFTQAEADTAKKFGGTGLGLAISRRFAEMMGGELNVGSEYGAGSTFTVIIPIQAPVQPAGRAAGSAGRG